MPSVYVKEEIVGITADVELDVIEAALEFEYPDLVATTVAVADWPEESPETVTVLPDLDIEPALVVKLYPLLEE